VLEQEGFTRAQSSVSNEHEKVVNARKGISVSIFQKKNKSGGQRKGMQNSARQGERPKAEAAIMASGSGKKSGNAKEE